MGYSSSYVAIKLIMANEEQTEEIEVLKSIFEEDESFKLVNECCIQYKFGEDKSRKSFLVEFSLPSEYPHIAPEISLDSFYNNHISAKIKENILTRLQEQANDLTGEAMIYTLVDWLKENGDDFMSAQADLAPASVFYDSTSAKEQHSCTPKPKVKKEHLTKAQKRKLANRVDVNGERPRGWNWIDPIKHLSQTGSMAQ